MKITQMILRASKSKEDSVMNKTCDICCRVKHTKEKFP